MNTSSPAPSIQDVWMQQGGARLYYSALYAPRQQYMGGASHIDPACSPLLPPMRAWGAAEPKKRSTARKVTKPAAVPCPEVVKPEVAVSTKNGATTSTTAGTEAASGKGGISAVQAGANGASSAAQSRAEAIAKAKAASAAEAAAQTKAAKDKPPRADKPAPVSAAAASTP